MCGMHFLQWPFFLIMWSANVISGTKKPKESLGSIIGKQSDLREFSCSRPHRAKISQLQAYISGFFFFK